MKTERKREKVFVNTSQSQTNHPHNIRAHFVKKEKDNQRRNVFVSLFSVQLITKMIRMNVDHSDMIDGDDNDDIDSDDNRVNVIMSNTFNRTIF